MFGRTYFPRTRWHTDSRHNISMHRAVCALFLLPLSAFSAEFSGTLVDVMCRGKDLPSHTRECAVSCAQSGFGLVTSDGKFVKFDD